MPLSSRRRGKGPFIAAGVLLLIAVAVVGTGIALISSKPALSADSTALAKISLPMGGGTIKSVSVTTGPHARRVPVAVRGQQIWPTGMIPAHTLLSVDVVVTRPGWNSWLTGSSHHLHMQLYTPSAKLRSHYLTLRSGSPIRLQFAEPVSVIAYGTPGHLHRQLLGAPRTEVSLHPAAVAGTLWVAAAPRQWETSKAAVVSWFPSGSASSAVAIPAPGSQIKAGTPITLTFNKPVAKALGASHPALSPAGSGSWHTLSSHSIQFRPEGYGYGLGAHVTIGLPSGVRLVGASARSAKWTVPGGSTLRLQQLLAQLGYLPLRFKGPSVANNPVAQESAAIHAPSGKFEWRYGNLPDALRNFWSPGSSGVMTEGALMAFQNDHGLLADGVPGVDVWRALITAADENKRSSFGYTFVTVSLAGQHLSLWHNGHVVTTTAVNTGIASRPTNPGTFPVYEHLRVTTMSGTNPDGSHYNDPGIQFVSYFNGGDALHAFTRAQYGFPQSLGCVEMALGPAGTVWPYTPIGTLVHVA